MKDKTTFLTGPQGGLSEKDQMKIALELILRQGGVATMSQVYEAVEKKLARNVLLSDQGKHSLRRIINLRAVEAGYIHPFDKQSPGWRITNAGVSFINGELGYSVGRIRVTAKALVNLELTPKDIRALLSFYENTFKAGRRDQSLDVFKRASLILTITAFETFVEDVLRVCVLEKLKNALEPNQIMAAFNTVAQDWYSAISQRQATSPKPADFVKWAGQGWKRLIQERLENDLRNLNTPKSGNIRVFTKRYVGSDITAAWIWPGMTATKAQVKLDKLITIRGELAHRIGDYLEAKSGLQLKDCLDAVEFIEKLSKQTGLLLEQVAHPSLTHSG